MRSMILAAVAAAFFLSLGLSSVSAQGCDCEDYSFCECSHWCWGGLWGRHHVRIDGLEPCFNCGCNGSHNYPVPPRYTYHWPGMYKQALMTEYQSPWRYPPIKPYSDEPLSPIGSLRRNGAVQPASAIEPLHDSGRETEEIPSVSSRLLRAAR